MLKGKRPLGSILHRLVADEAQPGDVGALDRRQHRIEIHTPAAGSIAFDVNVQAGQTITLRATVGPPL